MKERLLFHLRLGDSSSPLARRKSLLDASSSGGPPPAGRGATTRARSAAEKEDRRPPHLVCTCLHSSVSSAVAVGFERGVVHVYYRQHEDRASRSSEEERWKRTVIYPTRALGSGVASPIESPAAAAVPPDITCVAIAPGGGKLAVGTSDGFVFVTQAPPPPTGGSPGTGWARGSGFHHKSHRGKRINCLLWDNSGDQLYSVCEGGTVVLARNLRPRRGALAAGPAGITGVMQFLGVHQPDDSSKADTPASPQAIVVGHTGSPGVTLDLGRTRASLPGATKGFLACDVLLVMTRKQAVLFYFAVGEDVSIVAPHKTSVDLNVVDHTTADTGQPSGGNSSRTPPPPPPPSRTDFGGCLWGPAQMPGVGGSSSTTSSSAVASGARGRSSGGIRRTPERRESYEALPAASAAAAAPRAVLFAYVAQPGGRLWRVGLSDGEVESMHRPLGVDEGGGGGGLPVESGVELGEMWAVDVGDARALLCWRSGFTSKEGGEFALLDPNTHSFVAACPWMSGTVDVSGFVLSPFPQSAGGGSLQSIRQRLEVLGGGVRVLHGGDLAKVTMLYHNAEGEAWSTSSSEAIEGWGAALSAEAAARTVQRAWRATRKGGGGMAADTAAAEGGGTPPTATRDPPLQLLMPGDFPLRGRGAAAAAAPPSSLPSVRDVAAGYPDSSAAAGLQLQDQAERAPVAAAAAARGHRNSQDRDDSGGRVPETRRGGNGGPGGGNSRRRRGARSRSNNFSVRDSIEALDAADRALQLSSHSRQAGSPTSGDRGEDTYWPTDESSSRSRRAGGGGGGGDSRGNPSGSESDGGANAMCRATDALIRQTWPVLHRTGSLENLALPPDSPPFRSAPASFPTDARGRETRAATLPGRMTAGGGVDTEEEHALRQGSEEAEAEAATAVTGFEHRGAEESSRWDEEEEEEEEEATAVVSSPTAEPPPSAGWNNDDGDDERAERSRGQSPAGRETGGLDRQPSSLRSSIPFPRGPVGAEGGGGGGRPSRGTGSGFPVRSAPARPRRKSSPPDSQHGNLFGLGTLLQRSVQAVNEALQPGGGATSDEDSLPDGNDPRMFAENVSGGSGGGGGGYNIGNEDGAGADGGTTSDTGKESWSASSDRSEVGNDRGSSVTMAAASGARADGDESGALRAEGGTSDAGGTSEGGGGGRGRGPRKGEAGWKRRRKMLLISGMMGVKRQCLGTLRSRRESRIPAHLATVTELPVSAMDDPNPFVPPSQYEVRLNVSRGLGLSLNITGNEVRVKGFSPVQGGDIGPAQACGDIQVGDALVRVNHEQLNLLNHENVVRVLRGLLRTTGSQVLLLRFAYAEDSPRLLRATTSPPPPPPPPPPLPPKTPVPRPSTMENPRSEPRVSQGGLDTEEAFRSESWHGSSKPPRAREGQGQGREMMARSVSPHRRTGPVVLRSQSLGEGGPPAVAGLARKGSGAEAGDKEGEGEGWTVDGMRPRGKRRGELWGEPEMGLAGGDGGSRHIYLGDMGHARVQRTLQAIAEDVQGLYQVRHSSEECRFFHGRKRPSLTDPSPSSLEHRLPPPSTLLAPPPPPPAKASFASPGAAAPASLFSHGAPGVGGPEAPPPLPRELYRGRRRRRPRRRRSSSSLLLARASAGGGGGASGGEEAEEEIGGVINLVSCQGVVQAEVSRLEGELERQRARLARRNRRSSARSLVAKMLHKCGPSALFSDDSPSTTVRGSGRGLAAGASSGRWSSLAGGTGASWREESGGGGLGRLSDGDLTDSSDDVSGTVARRAAAATARVSGEASGVGRGEDGFSIDDDEEQEEEEEEEEGACDIFLEAVSTAGLQDELLCNRDVEVLGVDPPRPLPAAAYDLQTALESVQHFATQTLAGVVQAAAVRGSDLYDNDYDPLSGARSPRHLAGGGRAGKGSGAKEARDGGVAAGSVEGWEAAWPPRELTAALGLVTARQMAHAMRCDAEPLIQIWMRCFTPVDAKHRTKLWGGLAPPPSVNDRFLEAGRWHRQLVCGLLTLYAQVHMSWPFLARPKDDPDAVGLRSLRLETTWFGTQEDVGSGGGGIAEPGNAAAEEESPIGAGSAAGSVGDWDEAGGGAGGRGPLQWDEEKAVGFIQDYGAYLEADAVAAAASCREMEWALDEVLRLAEQCEDYKSKERVLHQLLRGPRTPSMTTVSGRSSPTVWHQRSAMFGTTPARSPANSVSTAGTRTPGNWTPTVMSPSRAAFPSYQLPSEAMSAGGGGGGSGWKDGDGFGGTLDAALSSGPMEEDAVRKALGLLVPPADPAGNVVEDENHRRHANAEHGQGVGFSGHEAGGSGRLLGQTTNQAPGGAPLCLLLNNLGELFRWDVAAAAEMCADAFPGVRPWNVHHALHRDQDKPWTTSEPVTPVEGGTARYQAPRPAPPAGAGVAGGDGDGGTRTDAAFHAYLWAVLRKHPGECRGDWKVIQRCLQLSLRLSTKLRSLPSDHPVHSFCKTATRNFKRRRRADDPATRETEVRQPEGAFSTDARIQFHNSRRWRAGGGSGGGSGMRTPTGDLRLGVEDSGETRDGSVWRRYSDVVEEVVSQWCKHGDTFGLDPLWLLPKLRAHKNWPVAFRICGAITCSWEEEEEEGHQMSTGVISHCYATAAADGLEEGHDYGSLGSTLPVFDTLADACFATFNDGDTETLAAALGATWAADGALRRVSLRARPPPLRRDDSGGLSPGQQAVHASLSGGENQASGQASAYGNVAAAAAAGPELGHQAPTGSQASSSAGAGACAEEESHEASGGGRWVEESRMVDVVRGLARRCSGQPVRADDAGGSNNDGGDADGRGDTDLGCSSTGGVDASMTSEDPEGGSGGSGSGGGGGLAGPLGALSLLELAEAVLDAVGPEATGDVLAACPHLLEGIPPKFFQDLADRQAALSQQRALEAALLHQATAAIWASRGRRRRTDTGAGDWGGSSDASPLGPRLAWLACEELTSFFQDHANSASASPNARLLGGEPGSAGSSCAGSPPGLQHHHRATMEVFAAGVGGDNLSRVFSGFGGNDDGLFRSLRRKEPGSVSQGLVATMGVSLDLNLVLPGNAHRGAAFDPASPCGFCGLALSGGAVACDGGGEEGEGELVLCACGRGIHSRCLAAAGWEGGWDSGRWYEAGSMLVLPCPQCA